MRKKRGGEREREIYIILYNFVKFFVECLLDEVFFRITLRDTFLATAALAITSIFVLYFLLVSYKTVQQFSSSS